MNLLSQLVQHAAQRDSEKTAVRFLEQRLSYGQLDRRSNQLAALLRDEGVRRGDRVGIYMSKDLLLPVAMNGIMKAGAAYVPLDPGTPQKRLRAMIQDCGITHLVTQGDQAKAINALCREPTSIEFVFGAKKIPATRTCGWDELESSPTKIVDVGTTQRDLAYIIYTSGSTGTPKGIMHTHASALSYATIAGATYGLRATDRISNHSPIHFDMSKFDFFSAAWAGATTVIISEAHMRMPASLSQLIQDEQLTIWYSVPFALTQLLLHGVLEQRDLSSLRWVLFAGEVFPPKHLAALTRLWPHARFGNVYGPAELNQCTLYNLPKGEFDCDQPVPIGRVWNGSEAMIVDHNDQIVTDGQEGELLVCSPTMMAGYWGQPDLTQRALLERPRSDGGVDVFYRTGDLVQRQPDGQMQFLGRIDRQIKVRGHRVELDEIERVLVAHPHVEAAAAFDVPGREDTVCIEAVVVFSDQHDTTTDDLRRHVKEFLPAYAVPETIRSVNQLPRTPSGKTDRRYLQAAAVARPKV